MGACHGEILDEENAGSINVAGAWEQLGNNSLPDDEKVLVAVNDTGARLSHVDLQDSIIKDKFVTFNDGKMYDFQVYDNADDDIGHGTNVTGIIGADINNNIGLAGIASGRSNIIVIDTFNEAKELHTIDSVMAIYHAVDQGAKVINMSFGGHCTDKFYEQAIKYAWDKGTTCICASGNENISYINSPSDSPYAVSVMAH